MHARRYPVPIGFRADNWTHPPFFLVLFCVDMYNDTHYNNRCDMFFP